MFSARAGEGEDQAQCFRHFSPHPRAFRTLFACHFQTRLKSLLLLALSYAQPHISRLLCARTAASIGAANCSGSLLFSFRVEFVHVNKLLRSQTPWLGLQARFVHCCPTRLSLKEVEA